MRFVRLIAALKRAAASETALLEAACRAADAEACVAIRDGVRDADVVWLDGDAWRGAPVPPVARDPAILFEVASGRSIPEWSEGTSVGGELMLYFGPRNDISDAYADMLAMTVDVLSERDRVATRAFDRTQALERARIARDIHSGPAQDLATAAVQLEVLDQIVSMDTERARELTAEARASAKAALNALRVSIADLTPASRGEPASLTEELADCSERFGARVDIDAGAEGCVLDEDAIELIRSFLEEGMTNIRKHVASTQSEIRASLADGVLRITVSDLTGATQRVAFEEEPGHGLHLMRGYARLFGGDVFFEPTQDASDSVTLRLPV